MRRQILGTALLLAALWVLALPGLLGTTLLLGPDAAAAMPLPVAQLAITTPQPSDQPVVEQLRLKVPEEQRRIWLEAEKATWEPWLAEQEGFLGRELLWDPLHGEATLLIRWASRAQWKAIPQAEIDAVQSRFEEQVRQRLGSDAPTTFPLLYEGELINPEV